MELNIQTVGNKGIKLGRPRLGEQAVNQARSEYMKQWRANRKAADPTFLEKQNEYQKRYNAANKARHQEIIQGTQLRKKIRDDLAKEFFKTDV